MTTAVKTTRFWNCIILITCPLQYRFRITKKKKNTSRPDVNDLCGSYWCAWHDVFVNVTSVRVVKRKMCGKVCEKISKEFKMHLEEKGTRNLLRRH